MVRRLAGILALTLLACRAALTRGAPVDASRLTDGVFEGSAGTTMDTARVIVTVEGKRIARVELAAFETSLVGAPARDMIPQRIVERQSTSVDVVSGATDASNVIASAVEKAVQKSYAKATDAR